MGHERYEKHCTPHIANLQVGVGRVFSWWMGFVVDVTLGGKSKGYLSKKENSTLG